MAAPLYVLVVDDERDHREIVVEWLGRQEIACVGCEGAGPALDLLRSGHAFDLIIADVVMPEMDGLEFADRARTLRPEIPIVFVTGRAGAVERVLAAGDVAMIKPYDLDALTRVFEERFGNR